MKIKVRMLGVVALSVYLALVGCSKNNPVGPAQAPEQGKMVFALDAADNVVSGKITIAKGTLTEVLPITITNHAGSVLFQNIQAGKWTIAVQLFDQAGTEIYSGSGEGNVAKDQTTTVSIRVNHNTGNLQIIVELPTEATPTPTLTPTPSTGNYRIAYAQNASIYAVNTDGTNLVCLMTYTFPSPPPHINTFFQLDHNSIRKEIIFSLWLTDSSTHIVMKMNEDGSNLHELTRQSLPDNMKVRWSFNGSTFAANNYGGISFYGPEGEYQSGISGEGMLNPCWMPDGTLLYSLGQTIYRQGGAIFYQGSNAVPLDCAGDGSVLVASDNGVATLHSDGTGFTKISDNISNARFSPDGKKIIGIVGYTHLSIMNRDGSGRVDNLFTAPYSYEDVCFIQ